MTELVPEHWPSYSALKMKLIRQEAKGYGISRLQRGCYSKEMLVDFDTLPPAIQKQLGDPRIPNHILNNYFEMSIEARDFYTDFTYPDGTYLKEDSRQQYIINASVMEAIIRLREARYNLRKSMNGSTRNITQTLCTDAITFQDELVRLVKQRHTLPTHPRRFREAMKAFEDNGYMSLIKDSKGRAKQNAQKMTDEVVQLLNSLFATQSHKPTPTEVYGQYDAFLRGELEVIDTETGLLYETDGFVSLSESTVKRYLNQWQNRIITHHVRSGNRQQFMQKYKPHHSLSQPKFAGSIISVDDRQPPFEYEKGQRMWWYLGVDLGSEAITCWAYGKTKEGIITEFYQNLIRNYATWNVPVPHQLECESSLNSSFKDTFLRPGQVFADVNILANNARAKRIERVFRDIRYGIEKKEMGWLARPFNNSEANQAGKEQKVFIPYEQLVEMCFNHIRMYNNMEHSKVKGKSRWQVFMENQHPDLKPVNWKATLPFLGNETHTSVNVGIIRFRHREWLLGNAGQIATGDKLLQLMQMVEGEDIIIRWLDDHEGRVLKALVYHNDRYICEAIAKPVYSRATLERTEADEKQMQLMNAYVTTVESYRKRGAKQLDKLEVLDNRALIIDDSFDIPGMTRKPIAEVEHEPEVMEPMPEEDDIVDLPVETSFKRSLKDRW